MGGRRKQAGFTLVEMIVVVGMVAIIAAVVFVNVIAYQRSMELLELDTTAKEIYIAAQNHLSMATDMGLLEQKDRDGNYVYDEGERDDSDPSICYFVYPTKCSFSDDDEEDPQSVLDLMLPFGSIDETVRVGNSFIIRYQKRTGTILDVYYAKTHGKFAYTFSGNADEYEELFGTDSSYRGENNAENRKEYGEEKSVIGYHGELGSHELGDSLSAPVIEVHNEDKLWVRIQNPNMKDNDSICQMKLIVTGVTSKAKKDIPLLVNNGDINIITSELMSSGQTSKSDFTVVLDDVTVSDLHFSKLFSSSNNGKEFIPGENLKIQAVCYDNTKLTNVAYSDTKSANSLFASVNISGTPTTTNAAVRIRSIRHLENLDTCVSGMIVDANSNKNNVLRVDTFTAEQSVNLYWDVFCNNIASMSNGSLTENDIKVFYSDDNGESFTKYTNAGTYLPVNPDYLLTYDGNGHSIRSIKVSIDGPAGLFGTVDKSGSIIRNLELVECDINSTGDSAKSFAGTLAGQLKRGVSISNVLVHNRTGSKTEKVTAVGVAGGLIGKAEGTSSEKVSINKCASAVRVSSTASEAVSCSGGLVGNAVNANITCSYAAGYTSNGKYDTSSASSYNVIASTSSGKAGGLVGDASDTKIQYCYSTCSAAANTAGGLIGSATNQSNVSSSYSVGKVLYDEDESKNGTKGALVGTQTDSTISGNYYGIVNNGLGSVSNATLSGVSAFDESNAVYHEYFKDIVFIDAKPYDQTLATHYNNKYPFKSVKLLGGNVGDNDFISKHYGDWPSYETFVVNTKSST